MLPKTTMTDTMLSGLQFKRAPEFLNLVNQFSADKSKIARHGQVYGIAIRAARNDWR